MAGWMTTPLGTEVGLGPGHIVLDGVPAPAKGAQYPPLFSACLLWPWPPISATAAPLFSDYNGIKNVATEPNFGQNRPKISKMAITSVVCDISIQSLVLGFEIRFQLSANYSYVTLPCRKAQTGVTMTTNFGTKIAINAFLREISRTEVSKT